MVVMHCTETYFVFFTLSNDFGHNFGLCFLPSRLLYVEYPINITLMNSIPPLPSGHHPHLRNLQNEPFEQFPCRFDLTLVRIGRLKAVAV